MIKTVIDHLNSIISGMPFFTVVHGICEQKLTGRSDIETISFWNGTEFKQIDLEGYGFTYWRKRSDITTDEVDNLVSCQSSYDTLIPLRFFALTTRSEFPSDDAYSADRLASTLIKALTLRNGPIKRQIGASSLVVKSIVYSTDTEKIITEEFKGLNRKDFRTKDLVVVLDVDINIVSVTACTIDACDYIPEFPLLLENYIALP